MSDESHTDTPTVVLVHGAFADGSSWSGVIERLKRRGVKVTAPANPLRGIEFDSAYTASILRQTSGPVVLVGHSYGGAVISNAAAQADNVVGLVFVAAFAPDEGERLGEVEAGSKDSVLNSALVPLQYPSADGGSATEFVIDPSKAREAFAGDLSDEQAALIAAVQRPVAEGGVLRAQRPPGLEAPSVVGRCCYRRQSRGDRRRPLDGGAGGSDDHRGRRLARDHGVAA
jgi:pimeloyl-ACP methyl ester carboxylesterase